MLAWIGIGLAGFFGVCTLIVIGCFPIWVAHSQDGDFAELGLLEMSV